MNMRWPPIGAVVAPKTVAHFALEHAEHRGDAVAMQAGRTLLTYRELTVRAAAIARLIVETTDVSNLAYPIGIFVTAATDFLPSMLAMLSLGIPYVPLDPTYPSLQNRRVATAAGIKAILVDEGTRHLAEEVLPNTASILLSTEQGSSTLSDFGIFASSEDIAAIYFTSGSTGQPKGVWRNHRALVEAACQNVNEAGLGSEDRIAVLHSLCGFPSERAICSSLVAGSRLCVVNTKNIDRETVIGKLLENKITFFHSLPSFFRQLFSGTDTVTRELASGIRWIRLGGERVLAADLTLYKSLFPQTCRLQVAASTTECGTYASWVIAHDTRIDRSLVPVGRPPSNVEVSLVGDNGQSIGLGELGEIVVKTSATYSGYWHAEGVSLSLSVPLLVNGEFHTGDMGRMLPDGLLELVGRRSRSVNIGDATIHPAEIEAAIDTCQGVAEAIVVASCSGGEARIVAFCSRTAGANLMPANLHEWCSKQLPAFMQPTEIRVLDSLPRLPSGKIDVTEIRRLATVA